MKLLYIFLFSFSSVCVSFAQNNKAEITGLRQTNGFELLSFDAVLSQPSELFFSWKSLNDNNIDTYVIECSEDAINFESLTVVNALKNGQPGSDYSLNLKVQKSGICYFRLKINDYDGQVFLSKIVSLRLNDVSSEITIFPNPSPDNVINLGILTTDSGKCDLKILGRTGRVIYSTILEGGVLQHQFDLEQGYYVLILTESNGKVITKKMIVN